MSDKAPSCLIRPCPSAFRKTALTTASGGNLVRAEINRDKQAALWAVAPIEVAVVVSGHKIENENLYLAKRGKSRQPIEVEK